MKKFGKIVIFAFVGLCIVYGIAVIVYTIKNSESVLVGIISCFPIVLIGGVMSMILLFSALGTWGTVMRKLGRGAQAKQYEGAVKQSEREYESVKRDPKTNYGASSQWQYRASGGYFTKKRVLASFIILCVGVVLFLIFYAVYGNQCKIASNPNFIETTATVQPVRVKDTDEYAMCYVYWVYDAETDTNRGYVFDGGQASGVNFREGKTITICYNVHNPEIARTKPNPNLVLAVAIFVISVCGVLAFLNLVTASDSVVAIGAGAGFFLFAFGINILISQSAGLTLAETLFCGPLIYGANLFGMLGILFMASGVFGILRRIYYRIYWRRNNCNERIG